jgi:hypothetical protein
MNRLRGRHGVLIIMGKRQGRNSEAMLGPLLLIMVMIGMISLRKDSQPKAGEPAMSENGFALLMR